MPEIGSLTPVDLRDVWPNEAADLTPWLAKNPDLLGKELGMDLQLKETEAKVGSFSADILFRASDRNALVVVENMMGSTDHDHLGKVITYASGLEAAEAATEEEGLAATYAVLLAKEFRPEHRTALTWLNTHTKKTVGFFGVALEAWCIGSSPPAPRLSIIVRPDDWARQIIEDRGLSPEQRLRSDFWSEFLPPLDAAHPSWRHDAPKVAWWLNFLQAGRQSYAVGHERVGSRKGICVAFTVEGDDMERIEERLLERRATIEEKLGEELHRKATPKRRRLFILNPESIDFEDRERWPEVRAWAIKRLGDLRDAIQPHLEDLALAEDGA